MSENQVEIRSVIKYLFLKGKDNMKILEKIHSVYGTDPEMEYFQLYHEAVAKSLIKTSFYTM